MSVMAPFEVIRSSGGGAIVDREGPWISRAFCFRACKNGAMMRIACGVEDAESFSGCFSAEPGIVAPGKKGIYFKIPLNYSQSLSFPQPSSTSTQFSVYRLSHRLAIMDIVSNSTLLGAPETYMGIYNELSKYNVHLNIFERLWAVSLPLET